MMYAQNPEPQPKSAREYFSKSYKENPEPKRIKARKCSQKNYIKYADSKKSKVLKRYCTNRNAILSLLRSDYVKNNYSKRAIARLRYALNKEKKMQEYGIIIMNAILKKYCIECVQIMHYLHQTMRPKSITMKKFIVNYADIVEKLITSINVNDNEDQSYDVKCRVASSILLESVLKNRIHKNCVVDWYCKVLENIN